MADLIGAPLNAACEAQLRLAKSTADFINQVGFTTESDPEGNDPKQVPRQIDFAFWRPTSEGVAASPSGIAKVEKVAISVPLLALINIPSLSIKSIDISFEMEVKSAESSTSADDKSMALDGSIGGAWGPIKADVKIAGSISSHRESTRSSDSSAKYHVEIKARDDGMPEGLCRVIDMLQSSIRPLSVSPPTSPAKAQLLPPLATPKRSRRPSPPARRSSSTPPANRDDSE